MTQLDIHKRIEEFFKAGVDSADIKVAQDLLVNDDARRFFFSQANDVWLGWLLKDGFLDGIKKKSESPNVIAYRMPELEYLMRIAEKEPSGVAMVISSVNISEAAFNPEVIDRFLWIINSLPAEQIKTLTEKIRNEEWVSLMWKFRKSGYEFEKIIKKLVEKKENKAILELAQAIFAVKTKEEISKEGNSLITSNIFYVNDLDASGIFEALAGIDETHSEQALGITTGVMTKIMELSERDETKVFDYADSFSFFDVDFFTLEIQHRNSYFQKEDIENLAAMIKKLIERTVGKKCGDAKEVRKLFDYVGKIPSSRSMWRLRLFALSQCPEVFKNELKDAFFKLFKVENYYEIEGGTEYKKALNIAFPNLSDYDQRDYVAKVFRYFSDKSKKDPDKVWIRRTGWEILSSIPQELLNETEKEDCKKYFDNRPDPKFKPVPTVGEIRSGFVNRKSPVNLDDFTIDQIITNLQSEWAVEKLSVRFKDDDSLSPRGAEGLGDALKENIKKRTNEYLKNIGDFFDRTAIHPHYMYSLLRGIEEMLRNKQSLDLEQIGKLISLFEMIRNEGEKNPFKRRDDKSWLTDWVEVHTVITDILLVVLSDKGIKEEVQKAYREKIKDLISYLFTIKDSPSKEHEKPDSNEPYHVAINSVRGRAYEAFVVFTENDGKKLAKDIKEIYKKVLLDDSLAVRFIIGRYLASFYFRDKKFIAGLLPEIFPKNDPANKDIYLASWEGYLSNTLYDKLFVELKDYYNHAITLDPKDYTNRKYSKGLDESLAIHIALAFAHLGLEIEDPLFVQFWDTPNVKRHQEFISFIGRSCLTRDQASNQWLSENKVSKEKLLKFWDWALKNVTEPEALAGFGFWVNPNNEVLDENLVIEKMARTLEKSDGDIDWDYGLLRRLPTFAKKNGGQTFEIIRHFLLDSKNNLNQNRRAPLMYEAEIKDALKIIYKNGDSAVKQKITDLINTLIEKGSSMFWNLKDVISEDK
jgi:hypothetical protein